MSSLWRHFDVISPFFFLLAFLSGFFVLVPLFFLSYSFFSWTLSSTFLCMWWLMRGPLYVGGCCSSVVCWSHHAFCFCLQLFSCWSHFLSSHSEWGPNLTLRMALLSMFDRCAYLFPAFSHFYCCAAVVGASVDSNLSPTSLLHSITNSFVAYLVQQRLCASKQKNPAGFALCAPSPTYSCCSLLRVSSYASLWTCVLIRLSDLLLLLSLFLIYWACRFKKKNESKNIKTSYWTSKSFDIISTA